MRVLLRLNESAKPEPPGGGPEPYLFGAAVPDRRARWPSFAVSLATHAAVLVLVSTVHFPWLDTDSVDWTSELHLEMVRLKVPARVFYQANTERPRPQPSPPPPAASSAPAAEPAKAAAAPARRFTLPPGLQLPGSQRSNRGPVILQPEFQLPTPLLNTPIPPLAFWARQAEVTRPPRRQLILPGRSETARAAPSLSAPPVLTIPNREPNVSDINIAMGAIQPAPALPVPPSSTLPVRMHSEESQAGAIDRLQGQPANVIAISPDPMPRDRVVAVPEGLRNIPAASHGNGDSGSSAAAHPEPAHQADAAAAQAAARPGNEPDGRAASQSAAAGGTGGPGGTAGAAVHSRPDGTASAEAAQSRNSGAAAPGKEPAPARAGREGGEVQSARNNAEGPGNRSHESNGTSPGMARRPEL